MSEFSRVERAIETIRAGGMVVMVDDEDRENEGDLVIAAQHCHADQINFMCREGRGLICLSLTAERVESLGLSMMVPTAPGSMGTAFTVSIEARKGVTTGISAADRAETIRVAAEESYGPSDLVSPGHIFPLRAQPGGVLVRSGHTEGSIDLARLAGCPPAAVICEIMREDGEMARMDDLETFAARHDLPIVSISDLIGYRLRQELLVEEVAKKTFASKMLGVDESNGWTIRFYRSHVKFGTQFVVLSKGSFQVEDEVLLRAQRCEILGDVFGYSVDDSASRLRAAVRKIEKNGSGVVLYVLGTGWEVPFGMLSEDSLQESVGLKPRETGFRDFGLGAQVLRNLGICKIRVLTNNPRKIVGLSGFGIDVVGSEPLEESE